MCKLRIGHSDVWRKHILFPVTAGKKLEARLGRVSTAGDLLLEESLDCADFGSRIPVNFHMLWE